VAVVELEYMQVLAEILNKKDWWVKKDDEVIKKKWEEEMKQAKGGNGFKSSTTAPNCLYGPKANHSVLYSVHSPPKEYRHPLQRA
jgi:hypothetical protein